MVLSVNSIQFKTLYTAVYMARYKILLICYKFRSLQNDYTKFMVGYVII